MYPDSGGSRSRPSDMDSGKPAFMSGASRPASSSLRGPSPTQARFNPWRLRRMSTGPEAFLCSLGMSGLPPCARTHLKQGLVPHLSGRWDVRQIATQPNYRTSFYRWCLGYADCITCRGLRPLSRKKVVSSI